MSDHSKALWRESSGSGVVLDAAPYAMRDDSGSAKWDAAANVLPRGAFVDYAGKYLLIDLATEYALEDVGGFYRLVAGGVAAARFVDTNGKYLATVGAPDVDTDARVFADGGVGTLRVVPESADRLELVAIANRIRLY
jgi:hypothetical protein